VATGYADPMDPWLQIVLGLIELIVGADLLVRGAVWIALKAGLSKMMVGLTLVAFSTSAPELVVSVSGAVEGNTDVGVGTVLGSNLANIGLIVGLSAVIKSIRMVGGRITFESNYLILATALTVPPFLFTDGITRGLGVVMTLFIILFTTHLVLREKKKGRNRGDEEPKGTALQAVAFIAVGGIGLFFGGNWLVEGSVTVATALGMPELLISMLIIGVGTSLPELATSALAARKGHPEIALGNVIGSNIFNVGMVLGITSLIQPLPVDPNDVNAVGPMLAGVVAVAVLLVLLRVLGGVPRAAGAFLLLGYAGFMTWLVLAARAAGGT